MADFVGFSVRRTLGAGSLGTVHLVRDHATGRFATSKHIPAARVPSGQAFRERLALAAGLSHPHIAHLLDVRRTGADWFVLTEYYPAGSLADLLARRGRLAVPELVTLLVPIAQALTAAHQIGLHHGHLGAGDIVFTADGRPILTDLGLHPDDVQTHGAQADRTALRELAILAGGSPTTFTPALFASDLVPALLALAKPAPIDLAFEAPDARESSSPPAWASEHRPVRGLAKSRTPQARRRKPKTGSRLPSLPRPNTRAVLLAIAALFATALLITGVLLVSNTGGSSAAAEAPSKSPPATQSPSTDVSPRAPSTTPARTTTGPPVAGVADSRTVSFWLQTLRALDHRRAISFATLDLSGLDAIYLRGSRPWLADRSTLAAYRRSGLTVQGLSMKIEALAIERQTPTSAALRVVDHLTAGALQDPTGRRTSLPPGQPTTRRITLTQQGKDWRITNITTP